ncbi:MAG: flavodoxin family protein [Streptosporangiaceae bacterium]
MTSTYTSNPPIERGQVQGVARANTARDPAWRNCRFLVGGLGNSQWSAFLAFPRYVHKKLSEPGTTPLADLGYGDVGSPVWERLAPGVERSYLAGPAGAVRGAAISGRTGPRRPTVPLLDLMLDKVTDAADRLRLAEIRAILENPMRPADGAAHSDRRGRIRRSQAARIPVVFPERPRVSPGGTAAQAALLLDELEPAHPQCRSRADRWSRGHVRAGHA